MSGALQGFGLVAEDRGIALSEAILAQADAPRPRRAPDMRASIRSLSDVGRLVYMSYMKTADHQAQLADRLFEENRRTAEETLLREAQSMGCGVTQVRIHRGEFLTWIRKRSDWSAGKIVNTYNNDLVRAIRRITEEVPTANRWVISHRLNEWEWARQNWKESQIGVTEGFVMSDEARGRFWEMNAVKDPECYFGYSLQCAICQEIAAGNPYTAREARHIGLPHPNCLDQWHMEKGEILPCNELWLGET